MATKEIQLANDKLPAHLQGMEESRGNENVEMDSMAMPRLKLIQKASNEVDPNHTDYMDGIKIGDFYNNLTQENYGNTFYAINVHFKNEYVAWKKMEKGGGLVGSFTTIPDAQEAVNNAAEKDGTNPEHYDINQTHTHVLLIKDGKTGELSSPILFDFASSKLRVSKTWNSQLQMKGGDRFAGLWQLKSIGTANRQGQSFMNLEVSFTGWAHEEDYKRAEKLYTEIEQAGSI
tara:strand:- start:586 stop:1281 length:696 start_codon:yes stop_codon:yes gene_type:complete